MKEHKKVIILTIIFIVIASVVWVMHLYGKKSVAPIVENSLIEDDIKVKELPTSELPPEIPKNIPIETSAPIMRNEIVDVSQGREVQHLRTYVSSKTVSENVKIYRDFFTKDGWKIAAESIDKNIATIIATKSGNTFKFTASKNSITSDVTVELVVTLRKVE